MSMTLQIFNKSCDECLFTKDKIVSNKRRAQVLKECIEDDKHFICHKASINGNNICCHSFIDVYGQDATTFTKTAHWLELVEHIDLDEYLRENKV